MSKKIKKKIKFKFIPFFIFIFLCLGIYFGVRYISDTKIKNIYIYGNCLLKDQEIISLAQISDYPSFYKTSSRSIKNNIKKSPYIKDVKIEKKFFNVLKIHIKEYIPLFIMNNYIILDNFSKAPIIDIKLPIASNINDEEILKKFVLAFLKVKANIRGNISEIIYSPTEYDKTRFLFYMDDGNHIYINTGKIENINYYDEIYPTLNNKKGTLYLDSGNHFVVFK